MNEKDTVMYTLLVDEERLNREMADSRKRTTGGASLYHSNALHFSELREFLEHIPVIESHEHFAAFHAADDPLDFILDTFYLGDFYSAGGEQVTGRGDYSFFTPIPHQLPEHERYTLFQQIYRRSDKTAYARAMQEGLRLCWGVEDIGEWEEYQKFSEKFRSRDASLYDKVMEMCRIKAQIVDRGDLDSYMDGTLPYSPFCRFTFHISGWRNVHTKEQLAGMEKYLGRAITCLDDYTEAFDQYLQKCLDFGVVCLKDLNAYRRTLEIGNPTRAEAEKAFNDVVSHQRVIFGDEQVRPLEDWMFHYALRRAAALDLPVQLHTGHMAGIRNDVRKANAVNLIPTLELHTDVRFDLFHANWPYMDEFLFIGKNYPNAYLDLCWAHSIDPLYCIELMKRAVMTVPHSKIMAFGGDTSAPEWLAGYLALAKDNVAAALAELVDSTWLTANEARQIALDWFFNNPNEFFKLGFEKQSV